MTRAGFANASGFARRLLAGLVRIGDPAVPALMEALQDKQAEVRSQAASVLGKIGASAKPATSHLLEAMKDKDAEVRLNAASALLRINPDQARTAVATLLELMKVAPDAWGPKEARMVLVAREHLARYAPSSAEQLTRALHDANPHLRQDVAATLGKIGPKAKEAVPELTAALDDKESLVRVAAASALVQIDPGKARPAVTVLIKAVQDQEELGPLAKPAIPVLSSLASQQDDPLGQAAAAALKKIAPQRKQTREGSSSPWDEILKK